MLTEGESTVNYMFMQDQFNWTIKDFSLFNASRIVIQIIGSIVGMIVLRRFLKMSIVTMAMLSLACCVLESTVVPSICCSCFSRRFFFLRACRATRKVTSGGIRQDLG